MNMLLTFLSIVVIICLNSVWLTLFREDPNSKHPTKQTHINTVVLTLLLVSTMAFLGFVTFNINKVRAIAPLVLVLTFLLLLVLPVYYWLAPDATFRRKHPLLLASTSISSVATIGLILFLILMG